MIADIINLRQAREDTQAHAERNRQRHGESNPSRSLREHQMEKAFADLSAHRREAHNADPAAPE